MFAWHTMVFRVCPKRGTDTLHLLSALGTSHGIREPVAVFRQTLQCLGLALVLAGLLFQPATAETGSAPVPGDAPSFEAAFATDAPTPAAPRDAERSGPEMGVPQTSGEAPVPTGWPSEPATAPEPTPAFRVVAEPGEPAGASEPDGADEASPDAPAGGLIELPHSDDDPPLEPVPDPIDPGPLVIEAASFKGVTPGATTLAQVQQAWGPPQEMTKQEGMLIHLYAIEPFDRIEVSYFQDKVTSVVVRFHRAFPAQTVAEQLELGNMVPVLVSNELGEILGQVYPERGVLFAFDPSDEPGQPSMQVAQIILEPITAETFILRAETHLTTQYESSRRDLEYAISLEGDNARAHWLLSRIQMTLGAFEEALASSARAVELDANDVRYRVTRAQVLGQVGDLKAAVAEATHAVQAADQRPHVKARAMCLLGDLHASGASPDYRRALKYHMEAIRVAGTLAEAKHPAVRLAAKEVLIDAHLGAAHDIAWGEWDDKVAAVPKWLDRARAVVEDVIENESGDDEHRFRLATRALAACVGMRGEVDPGPWTEEALRTGNLLVEAAADQPARTARLRWELGMALYDALQVYQMRGEHDAALRFGEQAIGYLEQADAEARAPTTSYLLGRLYFRLGAIHAIRDGNHREAIVWFDKALPELAKPIPPGAAAELGRHGETFVSMGVSYWEVKQRDEAVELTEHGLKLMQQAVEQGSLDAKALAVPYGNLTSMHRQMGREDRARQFERMATQPPATQLK